MKELLIFFTGISVVILGAVVGISTHDQGVFSGWIIFSGFCGIAGAAIARLYHWIED